MDEDEETEEEGEADEEVDDNDSSALLDGSLSTNEPLYVYPDSLLELEYPTFDILLFP